MNSDKSLITTTKTTLYQREKCVDKIQFLFPEYYEGLNLGECKVVLKYVDPGNVAHAEILIKDEELYKDRLRYTFSIDTKFTAFAGDIKIRVSFLSLNQNNGLHEEVLHTGETIITIHPLTDYFAFTSDESLEIIDKAMSELEARLIATNAIAEIYDNEKADDISLDMETASICLTSKNKPIGTPIQLNDLGDAIAEETESGLVQIITDEVEVPVDVDKSIKYSLQLNQETDELYLLANKKIVSIIKTNEIGESIIDSMSDGITEMII